MREKRKNSERNKPVALITGSARGIGRATAVALSRSGYDIAAVDVCWDDEGKHASASSLELEINKNGGKLLSLQGDISDLGNHAGWIDTIMKGMGRIDLLVNNAGVAPLKRCDILEMDPGSFDRVLGVNLRGAYFLTQQVANEMLAVRRAHQDLRLCIIFITSISASVSSLNRAEYCISKAGLSMAARLFADRLAPEGILVYEIRPGIIQTAMTAPVRRKYDRLIAEGLIPQKRWGYPEDVARVVTSLSGGAFDYSTGAVIEISGGMNIRRL